MEWLKYNRSTDLGECESPLSHMLALLPWASYSASPSLSFQFYEIGPVMPIQIVFLPGIRGLKKGKDPVNYMT